MKKRNIQVRIKVLEAKKKSLIKEVKEIDARYQRKEIDLNQYYETLLRNFGRNPKEIIKEYDQHIFSYQQQLDLLARSQRKFFTILFISVFLFGIISFIFQAGFTGLTIQETASNLAPVSNETFNETNNQTNNISETLQNPPLGNETSNASEPPQNTNTVKNETNNAPEPLQEITITQEGDFIEESHEQPEIEKPVIWKKKVKKENVGESLIDLPKEAEIISIKKTKGSASVTGLIGLEISAEKQGLVQKIRTFFRKILRNLTPTGRAAEEVKVKVNEEKNKKQIALEQPGEYEILYQTPAPYALEETMSKKKKKITVIGPESIGYKQVLTFASIEEKVKDKTRIHVFWTADNGAPKHEEIPSEPLDVNNDGYFDKVQWYTPHLSNQTFEVIIEISKAEHLDSQKNFISDITSQVKYLDEEWSEPIYHNEYVRVTFEEMLNASNDITLYMRNTQGHNTTIEVYAADSGEKIAEFPSFEEESYYKIYLTNLQGSQDTFDLKIKNLNDDPSAFLEINHIIDPTVITDVQPSLDIALTALNNKTFVIAWVDEAEADVSFRIYDTNGTNITDTIDVDTTVNSNSRVSLAAINSTAFVVAWYDGIDTDTTYAWYAINGTNIVPATDAEVNAGTTAADVQVIEMNDRSQICYVDQQEDDADVRTVLHATLGTGTETTIDGIVGATLPLQNLISCTAINTTRFAMIWFDDATNDATFSIRNQGSTAIIAPTDIDTNVGETGQVAITSMNQTYFAMGWFDSSLSNIQIAVRDKNNNILLTPTVIDANAGTSSRIAMATVRNSTEAFDGFIVAWNDRNANNIQAAVYNASGTLKYGPFELANDENTTSFLFDVYGKDAPSRTSICDNTFLFAYTNMSGRVIVKTLKINGNNWTGYCENLPPEVALQTPALPNIDLFENSTRNISVTFNVTDPNGAEDFNESTAIMAFSKIGEPTRSSIPSSCIKTTINEFTANITCNVTMSFFNAAGEWNITIRINDSQFSVEKNATFNVNVLNSISLISPPSGLTFPPFDPEALNIPASNDPLIIKNLGNYEGPVAITAYDLFGVTTQEDNIAAAFFSISSISGDECAGTFLANATEFAVAGGSLLRGPDSTKGIFFCLAQVPSVIAQDYSTAAPGSYPWAVRILLVSLIPRKKRKKRDQEQHLGEDERRHLGKDQALEEINKHLEAFEKASQNSHLSLKEIINYKNLRNKKNILIPVTIFSKDLGMLEALCKYLKDTVQIRYHEIAVLIKRDERTIWASYHQALKKAETIKPRSEAREIYIPIEELNKENLSIFESVVLYLRKMQCRYSEIATLLERDERNIWTTVKRASTKTHGKS